MVAERIAGNGLNVTGASIGRGWSPSRRSAPPSRMDTRLIAAVQSRAGGAHVHEAANLLQAYYGWADELAESRAAGDDAGAADADRALRAAAARLHRFLYAISVGAAPRLA